MPMFTVHSVAFGPTCHEKLSRTINSTEHQQLVHTLRTSCRSGWPRGFGEHEPSATVRRYQFTRRQWQKPDDPFSAISSSAQLRPVTNITPFEITVLMCEQKPCPGWFSCWHKSYPLSGKVDSFVAYEIFSTGISRWFCSDSVKSHRTNTKYKSPKVLISKS